MKYFSCARSDINRGILSYNWGVKQTELGQFSFSSGIIMLYIINIHPELLHHYRLEVYKGKLWCRVIDRRWHNKYCLYVCTIHHSHYNDAIISAMASQITSPTTVYSTVYSGTDQRKHQSSTSLAFVRIIHRWPVNSPHKGSVTRLLLNDPTALVFSIPERASIELQFKALTWQLISAKLKMFKSAFSNLCCKLVPCLIQNNVILNVESMHDRLTLLT